MYLNTLAQNYDAGIMWIIRLSVYVGIYRYDRAQRDCLLVQSRSQTAFHHLGLVKRMFQKLNFHCFPSENTNCVIGSFLAALVPEDLTECLSPSDSFPLSQLPTCQYPILCPFYLLSRTLSAPWCYCAAFFKTVEYGLIVHWCKTALAQIILF